MNYRFVVPGCLAICLTWPLTVSGDAGKGEMWPINRLAEPVAGVEHSRATPSIPEALTRFLSLEQAVDFYDRLGRSGHWLPMADGPLLKLGDSHEQIRVLRQHLRWSGDYALQEIPALGEAYFDESLHQALLRFQIRHGAAKVDGVLGPETRKLLNVPPWIRADQILLNINRQEQFARVSGFTYLQVNIPEYRLRFVADGVVRLDMKAIVGRASRQTPVFSSEVRSVVVNPSWSVPRSIALKDILPKWRRDREYLAKHNLLVLSGWQSPQVIVADAEADGSNWYRGAEYYRLWQPPGPDNTLGQLKFPVADSNGIYLHDTSNPKLFGAYRRAFSSGCIRLEKPRELAAQLMAHGGAGAQMPLQSLIDAGETRNLRLAEPVTLHITYWTAWLDEAGVLHFGEDLYHRDEEILAQSGTRRAAVD